VRRRGEKQQPEEARSGTAAWGGEEQAAIILFIFLRREIPSGDKPAVMGHTITTKLNPIVLKIGGAVIGVDVVV
jgi:hypothetical protein